MTGTKVGKLRTPLRRWVEKPEPYEHCYENLDLTPGLDRIRLGDMNSTLTFKPTGTHDSVIVTEVLRFGRDRVTGAETMVVRTSRGTVEWGYFDEFSIWNL